MARWDPDDFEKVGGYKVFLNRLAASPLPRQPLQDAVAAFDKFFELRRDGGEAMNKYIVRETETFNVFMDAIQRLKKQTDEQKNEGESESKADAETKGSTSSISECSGGYVGYGG